MIIIFLLITILGCQNNTLINEDKVNAIELLKLVSTGEKNPGVLRSFTQEKQIKPIIEAIATAEKIEGILDIAAPKYGLKIIYQDSQTKTFYLWIDKTAGMIMDSADNRNVGYRLSEKSVIAMNKLIEDQ